MEQKAKQLTEHNRKDLAKNAGCRGAFREREVEAEWSVWQRVAKRGLQQKSRLP